MVVVDSILMSLGFNNGKNTVKTTSVINYTFLM